MTIFTAGEKVLTNLAGANAKFLQPLAEYCAMKHTKLVGSVSRREFAKSRKTGALGQRLI